MLTNLFVYGTLLTEACPANVARVLSRAARDRRPGTIAGRLVDLGPYPGLRPAPSSRERVHGVVYRLADPARTLAVIDAYEGIQPASARGRSAPAANARVGQEYVRSRVQVRVAGEEGLWSAWAYLYIGPMQLAVPIVGGDYCAYLSTAPVR